MLEVLMHVDYSYACNFMFGLNKESRNFVEDNSNSIRNGYVNDGLITYELPLTYTGFELLQTLYLEALKRNINNRALTLEIEISEENDLIILNEALKWIKEQNQNI